MKSVKIKYKVNKLINKNLKDALMLFYTQAYFFLQFNVISQVASNLITVTLSVHIALRWDDLIRNYRIIGSDKSHISG